MTFEAVLLIANYIQTNSRKPLKRIISLKLKCDLTARLPR